MKNYLLAFILLPLFLFVNCSRKVAIVSNQEDRYLSGRWNSTDSRKVSDAMVDQILTQTWLYNHLEANEGKKPVVVVGLVTNLSHEHIDAEVFIKDIERAFITSQKVRLVQGGEKRKQLRDARADQNSGMTSVETTKKWGQELGADYMLQGNINSIVDQYKKKKLVHYKVNVELSNIETGEVVFIGDKEITKYITN